MLMKCRPLVRQLSGGAMDEQTDHTPLLISQDGLTSNLAFTAAQLTLRSTHR